MAKFELIKKYHNCSNLLPVRETAGSAGYDFKAAESVAVVGRKIVVVHTGVKVKLDKNQFLLVANRSSNPIKRGLILANSVGIIDSDYYNNASNEGEIMGMFYNISDKPYTIHKDDHIMQGIILNYNTVQKDKAVKLRTGGIGSTGK